MEKENFNICLKLFSKNVWGSGKNCVSEGNNRLIFSFHKLCSVSYFLEEIYKSNTYKQIVLMDTLRHYHSLEKEKNSHYILNFIVAIKTDILKDSNKKDS